MKLIEKAIADGDFPEEARKFLEPQTNIVCQSLEELQQDPPDSANPPTIHLVGRTPLADLPGLTSISIPSKWQARLAANEEPYFTLPSKLLDLIVEKIGRPSFDQEALEIEFDCSAIMGDHTSVIGYWRKDPIHAALGFRKLTQQDLLSSSANQAAASNAARQANEDLQRNHSNGLAYAGWLMCNPEFLQEHDELKVRFQAEMLRWGTSKLGTQKHPVVDRDRIDSPKYSQYEAAMCEFLRRWHLQALPAPRLPIPLGIFISGEMPTIVLQNTLSAQSLVRLPAIAPLPAPSALREQLQRGLRSFSEHAHLQVWYGLIGNDRVNKQEINNFARRFLLGHYQKAFADRHPQALQRRLMKLRSAFAKYFDVSADTIKRDLKKLGL